MSNVNCWRVAGIVLMVLAASGGWPALEIRADDPAITDEKIDPLAAEKPGIK